ncbi:MAG: hypothetical protein AB9915_02495 [Candidatus Dojkabacteria bacterium]
MKKILRTIVLLLLLVLPISTIYAQETVAPVIEQQVTDELKTEEDSTTQETATEEVQNTKPEYSFLTILGALLIPCIFIIIAYLILKLFKF